MNLTPQVETAEMSEADLGNISGGLAGSAAGTVAGSASGLVGSLSGSVSGPLSGEAFGDVWAAPTPGGFAGGLDLHAAGH